MSNDMMYIAWALAIIAGSVMGMIIMAYHYAALVREAFGLHPDVHVGKWLHIKARKRKADALAQINALGIALDKPDVQPEPRKVSIE